MKFTRTFGRRHRSLILAMIKRFSSSSNSIQKLKRESNKSRKSTKLSVSNNFTETIQLILKVKKTKSQRRAPVKSH
jgi:hypothetical protein